ncbi:MAG: hypothetical protein GX884_00775 [Chloroflexi bacterium]|nr:hypothetical protein [Chloroflexota bacterium]
MSKKQYSFILLAAIFVLLFGTACEPVYEGRPTGFPTQLPTNTITPTQPATPTEAPTVTPTLTITPTDTPTPIPSPTATNTPTVIPTRESGLIDLKVGENTTVDWGYHYLTLNNKRDDNSQYNLSAMLAFQLIDRGIHSETITLLGNDITVYYLRARHAFKGEMMDVKLVLTGVFGSDVAIDTMPADGSNFIHYRTQNSDVPFEPWKIDSDWNLPPEQRGSLFQTLTLKQFQVILQDLPNDFLLFAEHPVIIEPERWSQARIDMERISASGARLNPFFAFNEFDQLVGQTSLATILQQYLINNNDIPGDMRRNLIFSADYLLVITP